jgi:hypothetical protein
MHIFHVISSISFFAYVSLILISLREIYISICDEKKSKNNGKEGGEVYD